MILFSSQKINKIFLLFLAFFIFREIFLSFNNFGPESFFHPIGIIQFLNLEYDSFKLLIDICRWSLLFMVSFLIVVTKQNKLSNLIYYTLPIFILLGISFRFSFYHYPHLEMIAILISFGYFYSGKNKIENALKLSSIVYFFSGLTKLKYSGLSWLNSDSVRDVFIYSAKYRHTMFHHDVYNQLPDWLFMLIGVFTISFELSYPFLLYAQSFRKYLFYILVFFHVAIYMLIGIGSSAIFLLLWLHFIRAYTLDQTEPRASVST